MKTQVDKNSNLGKMNKSSCVVYICTLPAFRRLRRKNCHEFLAI